jgi:hypothetical protein
MNPTRIQRAVLIIDHPANQKIGIGTREKEPGFLASPAGNLKISCRGQTSISGTISAGGAGGGNTASTVRAFRLN